MNEPPRHRAPAQRLQDHMAPPDPGMPRVGGKDTPMIADNLCIAIMEAIKAHAERHHGGEMDLERTLSAIEDLASGYLAELTTPADRIWRYGTLIHGIARSTAWKIAQTPRPTTAQ